MNKNFFQVIVPLLSSTAQTEYLRHCWNHPECDPARNLLTKLGVPCELYDFFKDRPTLLKAIIERGEDAVKGALHLETEVREMERSDALEAIHSELKVMEGMNEEAVEAHMMEKVLVMYQDYHDQYPENAARA